MQAAFNDTAKMSSNIKTFISIKKSLLSAFEFCRVRDKSSTSTWIFFLIFAGDFPYLLLDNEMINGSKYF